MNTYGFKINDNDQDYVVYRIKYKNMFVTLKSGKTVWKTLGHSRSALRNHLYYSYGKEVARQKYDELVGTGVLEFVKCTARV